VRREDRVVAVTKRQLAGAVLTRPHIAEREFLAGFLLQRIRG
jgi:hypothetical protein